MEEEITRKPSEGERKGAPDGPTPAGRTCHSRQAKPERMQGPARPGAPKSARPDQQQVTSSPHKDDANSSYARMMESAGAGPPKSPAPQTLDKKGAMALAKRLETFWHERGFPAARFWAEPITERFEKVGTYEIYRVVSNLVNGMPPRYRDEDCR